jgi:hypothetical protein
VFAPPAAPTHRGAECAVGGLRCRAGEPVLASPDCGIQKDGHIVNLACELPDERESVLLPLMLLEILQPKLMAKFLESKEAVLAGL